MKFLRRPIHHNHPSLVKKSKPSAEAIEIAAGWQTHSRPIAFISGPSEVDAAYFTTHYIPRIREAIDKGHFFIIGPSRGIDTMALDYLRKSDSMSLGRVRLYLNSSEETHLRGNFKKFEEAGGVLVIVKGGHTERDEMMTKASHYDILRYRTEEECRELYGEKYTARVSGTEKNEIRRQSGVGLVFPIQSQPPMESKKEKL